MGFPAKVFSHKTFIHDARLLFGASQAFQKYSIHRRKRVARRVILRASEVKTKRIGVRGLLGQNVSTFFTIHAGSNWWQKLPFPFLALFGSRSYCTLMKKLNPFFGSRTKRKILSEKIYHPVPLLFFKRDIYPGCVDRKKAATDPKELTMIVSHAGQCKAISKRARKFCRRSTMRSMKVVGEKTFIHFSCLSRIALISYSREEVDFIFRERWTRRAKTFWLFLPPCAVAFYRARHLF